MSNKISKLVLSILVCLGAGFIGSVFTISSIPTWYATLNKPIFSPPNWVFGPVWTTLYIFMGISLYLVQNAKLKVKSENTKVHKAVFIFGAQLVLNTAWSVIFFGLKNPALAFIDIMVLWIVIFLTIKSFYPISRYATYLLIPYILWVSFAALLNLSIALLN